MSGVKFYAPEGCTVYADNRIAAFFPQRDMCFVPNIPNSRSMKNLFTAEPFVEGKEYQVKAKSYIAFITD